MQFAIQELQISGISDEKIASGCKVIAECFYGDPEVPIFTRLRERTIGTTVQRFDLNVVADRLASAWMHMQWSQAAGTDNVAGTFDESRSVQLELDGSGFLKT